MNLNDFMLLIYTFIIIILIMYVILKKNYIIYKHTGIDLLDIYNSFKSNLDKLL